MFAFSLGSNFISFHDLTLKIHLMLQTGYPMSHQTKVPCGLTTHDAVPGERRCAAARGRNWHYHAQ